MCVCLAVCVSFNHSRARYTHAYLKGITRYGCLILPIARIALRANYVMEAALTHTSSILVHYHALLPPKELRRNSEGTPNTLWWQSYQVWNHKEAFLSRQSLNAMQTRQIRCLLCGEKWLRRKRKSLEIISQWLLRSATKRC